MVFHVVAEKTEPIDWVELTEYSHLQYLIMFELFPIADNDYNAI